MKNHVVSLELAKQLKEAGYPQWSEKYWCWNPGVEAVLADNDMGHRTGIGNQMFCSAPLATELLEQIHKEIIIEPYAGEWRIWEREHVYQYFIRKSIPDALAEMYLYLKNENLL